MREGVLIAVISSGIILAILLGGFWFLEHNKKEEENQKINMSANSSDIQKNIREPAVAGQFYPADPRELADQIDEFLAKAPLGETVGAISGLMVPHAGYDYSGLVAAYGFGQLQDKNIDTIVLIGNSHRAYFDGAAIYDEGYFKTPLGEIEIDAGLAKKIIIENKIIKADSASHNFEHSLEVELPFLQRILSGFKLVPILMGSGGLEDARIVARAISKNITGKNVLVIASSDMSHYPSHEKANYADRKIYEAILTGQVEKLEDAIKQLESEQIRNAQTFLCGKEAVEVLMLVMQDLGVKDIKLLKYLNSGDVLGDKSQVVGYAAIGFYAQQSDFQLSLKEQQRLLEIARQSVEFYVKTGKAPLLTENTPVLNQKLGAFVTLKKNGELRGCIGNFTTPDSLPLWQTVSQMAVAAAAQDPRFLPVNEEELPKIEYEVSVLSPIEKIDDWHKIQLGKHGVEIKKGSHAGVFLPQVAIETGWDLETFMGQLCSQKAGLSWDCWKTDEVDLYIFTTQVFSGQR